MSNASIAPSARAAPHQPAVKPAHQGHHRHKEVPAAASANKQAASTQTASGVNKLV